MISGCAVRSTLFNPHKTKVLNTLIATRRFFVLGMGLFALFLAHAFALTLLAPRKKKVSVEDQRIRIHHADVLFHDAATTGDGQVLKGNVLMTHAGMRLTCDSAVFYEASNSFLAYGKVHFTQGDTLSLTGDSLYYDGSSQFARVFHHVVMRHRKLRLKTELLNYDRISGRGFYDVGGEIIDGTNILTSQKGDYFTGTREALFSDDVLLRTAKRDSLRTDSLHYNTKTKWAHATGPTNLLSGGSRIFTTDGYYNTQTEKARLGKRPQLFNKGRKLTGDSISYDKKRGFSQAFRNIVFTDSTDVNNKNILMGDYGWYKEKVGEALATQRALAKNFSRNADTLYVHADTLRLFSYDLRTDSAYRVLHGYFHVRAYRTDVQAVCDSLVFNSKQHQLTLYRDPIAWSGDRQILGEEINVYTNDSTIDSVYVERQSLIVQQLPDTLHFNQVSGNLLKAYFAKGELYQARVDGNAMVINYPMEKDSTFLYQNYCEAAKMRIDVADRKMQRYWAGPSPTAKTYPIDTAPAEHTKFSNFAWFSRIRPQGPNDLFEWRGKSDETKLKILPRRAAPMQTLAKDKATGAAGWEKKIDVPLEKASSSDPGATAAPTSGSPTTNAH